MKQAATTKTPPSLAFERRRWTAYFTLPFALLLAVSGIWSAVFLYFALAGNLGLALALLSLFSSLCIAISLGSSAWKSLAEKGPVLIVDARGITDHFHLQTFFPWSDIATATIDYGDGDQLTLTLREGALLANGVRIRTGLSRAVKRAFTGGDMAIPLASLRYNHHQLREALKYYLSQTPH